MRWMPLGPFMQTVSPTWENRWLAPALATTMIALGACGTGHSASHIDTANAVVGGTSAATAASPVTPRGPVPRSVDELGSHGEDLYDAVSAGRWSTARGILDSLGTASPVLPPNAAATAGAQSELLDVLDTLRGAVAAHNRTTALEAANRVTYLAAEMSGPYQNPTPTDVALLDFYGRELQIWAAQHNQARLQQTVRDLKATWEHVKPVVISHGGAAAATHTDQLVARIDRAKTSAAYAHAASPFLDQVDVLEKVFSKH